MKIPIVKNCCCCCGLRTGTAIIGVCLAVFNLTELCYTSVDASEATEFETKGRFISQAVPFLVFFASNLVLLWATHKERTKWILPWLFVYACSLINGINSLISASVIFIFTNMIEVFISICVNIVCEAIVAYCLIVVYSYYLSMIGTRSPVPVQEPCEVPVQKCEGTVPETVV